MSNVYNQEDTDFTLEPIIVQKDDLDPNLDNPIISPIEPEPPKKKKNRPRRFNRRRNIPEQNQINDFDDFINLLPPISLLEIRFKSLFSCEFRTAIYSLIFVLIFYFSSNLGIDLPTRFEIITRNATLNTGFFKKETTFYPEFDFQRKHSKIFLYYLFQSKNDENVFDPEHYDITSSIQFSEDGPAYNFTKVNQHLLMKSHHSETEIQLLGSTVSDKKFNHVKYEIKFQGDLSQYKTVSFEAIVYNSSYLRFLTYYRFLFFLLGLIFFNYTHFSFLNSSSNQIIGYLLIFDNFASLVFNVETSQIGFIVQKTTDSIFNLALFFVYYLAIKSKMATKSKLRIYEPIFVVFAIPFLIFFIVESLSTSISEIQNIYAYLHSHLLDIDIIVISVRIGLLCLIYCLHYFLIGPRIGFDSFLFFAAQISCIFDEVLERYRVIKCTNMSKWIRMFLENMALIYLTQIRTQSEYSEKIINAIPISIDYDYRNGF